MMEHKTPGWQDSQASSFVQNEDAVLPEDHLASSDFHAFFAEHRYPAVFLERKVHIVHN